MKQEFSMWDIHGNEIKYNIILDEKDIDENILALTVIGANGEDYLVEFINDIPSYDNTPENK